MVTRPFSFAGTVRKSMPVALLRILTSPRESASVNPVPAMRTKDNYIYELCVDSGIPGGSGIITPSCMMAEAVRSHAYLTKVLQELDA
ncbi:MAG TPA: hypothetical protein VMW72_07690 [Sedimentisphaerales bacterium]|nr:hypothetical protein [Sedimentisphaerales bacterium]